MKRKLNRKVIIFLAIIILIVLGIIFFLSNKSIVKKKEFVFEFGEIIKLEAQDILKTNNKKILKNTKVTKDIIYKDENDYPEVGEYKVEVRYNFKSFIVKVIVRDTTKPEFSEFSDSIDVLVGTKEIDYASYFKYNDLSEVELIVDDSGVDFEKTGEYKIKVTIKDSSNNEITKVSKVIVKENNKSDNDNIDLYYVKGLLVVNKKHPLPKDYAPLEDKAAGKAIKELITDMQVLGYDISNSYSGYRSYSYQTTLYQNYVNSDGQEAADRYSARAGYSEHQSGLAFDLKHLSGALVTNDKEATWIALNAYKYGFIVRYLEEKEEITGYMAEPWHLRYIGSEAEKIYKSQKTLEEYLGIEGGGY